MIDYELDKVNRVLRVRVESSLDKKDFAELAKAVDPEIENEWRPSRPHHRRAPLSGMGQFRGGSGTHQIRPRSPQARQEDRGRHRFAPWRFRRASGLTLHLGNNPTVSRRTGRAGPTVDRRQRGHAGLRRRLTREIEWVQLDIGEDSRRSSDDRRRAVQPGHGAPMALSAASRWDLALSGMGLAAWSIRD